MIKNLYRKIINYSAEEQKLLSLINNHVEKQGVLDILDVGCGYGRILRLLKSKNYNALGVEINPLIVDACKREGLPCVTVDSFINGENSKTKYDAIVMFHVIEHLESDKCFEFIDSYLDYLKPGGILIIATPLLTKYFYEDFDHIKPYSPVGIQMVFGEQNAQVQYRSRNKIELINLWYKRYFYRVTNQRFLYFPRSKLTMSIINLFSALIFKMSFGLLGKKDGWVGVFRKLL